jgi:hypothetical protein
MIHMFYDIETDVFLISRRLDWLCIQILNDFYQSYFYKKLAEKLNIW